MLHFAIVVVFVSKLRNGRWIIQRPTMKLEKQEQEITTPLMQCSANRVFNTPSLSSLRF